MLTSIPQTALGFSTSEAIAAALAAHTYTINVGLQDRITQVPDLIRLSVGLLCGSGQLAREECDYAWAAASFINNKTDGFFDELLPNALIVLNEAPAECGGAALAVRSLQSSVDSLAAVVGPNCTEDVINVTTSSTALRPAAFIAPATTAAFLSDETLYPYLARSLTADNFKALSFAGLCAYYSWRRVGVLHDDSAASTTAAASFISELGAISTVGDSAYGATTKILNANDTSFSLTAFDAGTVTAHALLLRLQAARTRILYLAIPPHVQRALFSTAYRSNLLYGAGFAYMIEGLSAASYTRPASECDTSGACIDIDAMQARQHGLWWWRA